MIRSKEEAEKLLEEYVWGFMFTDIERGIRAGMNYSVALCLLSYTEFLGGLIDGSLGLSDRGASGRFRKALEYFSWNGDHRYYVNFKIRFRDVDFLEKDGDIYNLFRCGLAHEYFIKGDSLVHNNPDGTYIPGDQGVGVHGDPGEERLRFHANAYFRDFKAAWESYRRDLLDGNHPDLVRNFNNALDRIHVREIRFS